MRAFVVVLDACGVGALPDAGEYGDAGTHTLAHVAAGAGGLDLPVLARLGLGSITPLEGVAPAAAPAVHGRLHPLGPGKDTIRGHWELMGVVAPGPLPTYPDGFPPATIAALRGAWGREIIGNAPADGLEVLERLGPEHLRTGAAIVYTSADSVLQVAAHEDVIAPAELHAMCAAARELVDVGRVIARPFTGAPGSFARTARRRDFALAPPARSYLQEIDSVHAVGKVDDVFGGVGIDHAHPGHDNATALASVSRLVRELDSGLVFANLVDTDQVYGHRKDMHGFAGALARVDAAVGEWLEVLDPARDLLVITADHGVDPAHPGWDHTREYVPLLATPGSGRHDGPMADVGATCLHWLHDRTAALPGTPWPTRSSRSG
jgi:phosphopentomutase